MEFLNSTGAVRQGGFNYMAVSSATSNNARVGYLVMKYMTSMVVTIERSYSFILQLQCLRIITVSLKNFKNL